MQAKRNSRVYITVNGKPHLYPVWSKRDKGYRIARCDGQKQNTTPAHQTARTIDELIAFMFDKKCSVRVASLKGAKPLLKETLRLWDSFTIDGVSAIQAKRQRDQQAKPETKKPPQA